MTLNEKTKTKKSYPTKISTKGYVAISQFEGLSLKAYKCPAGKWTIGYGHTENVSPTDKISYEEAGKLLCYDLKKVYRLIPVKEKMTQGMFDALASFIFNVGASNFKKSTLKKMVENNVNDANIGKEFCKWVRAGGVILQGLVNRRKWEAKRYYEKD